MSNFKRTILISLCSLLALGSSSTHEEMLIKIKRSIGQHLYEWRIYLNADKNIEENGKLVESLEDYVIPDIKFYSTPDLKGKPVAYINSKGYFEEGVQYCHRERP